MENYTWLFELFFVRYVIIGTFSKMDHRYITLSTVGEECKNGSKQTINRHLLWNAHHDVVGNDSLTNIIGQLVGDHLDIGCVAE